MGALTIRNLDDAVVAAIKRRAGERGISMEEEIRQLLAATYAEDSQVRGREWALRQLEHLERGELPRGGNTSVEEIRAFRADRDRKKDALRKRLNDSIARGGFISDGELDAALSEKSASLAKEGF